MSIQLDHNQILLSLRKEAFHSSVLTLNIDGAAETVLLRDAQVHPYKALVLHCDFQRVDATHAIHQKVPLHFINADQAPGVKLTGGNVSHVMGEIEVTCLPQDLPAFIEVDLKDLAAGQSIHVSQLTFPAGVKPVVHGDDGVVALIQVKRGSADAAAEGETPAA
jgi:large subunit ribosomal protein L25